jgi:uncharacterized glyoxalase superfamily protein PhnB
MPSSPSFVTLVPIRNMTRAIRYFTKQLGGKLVMRGTGDMRDGWASMRIAGHDVWLIAPDARESRKLAYTSLVVKDAKRYVKTLQQRGVKFQRAERMGPEWKIDGPLMISPYGSMAYFKDPEGNLWMVFESPDDM